MINDNHIISMLQQTVTIQYNNSFTKEKQKITKV